MEQKQPKQIKAITSKLREHIIEMPKVIRKAPGFSLYGTRIKSLIYSSDVSVIANTDADAVFSVYPFTYETSILRAIMSVAKVPVLAGVGGGLTNGVYCGNLAFSAQENGAEAVVLNGPVDLTTVKAVRKSVDIPVIYTVIDKTRDLQPYVDSGVNIFNVSGGKDTVELVKWVREQYPDMIIIASGGKSDESILATIEAGADAITYTTYGKAEQYFQEKMESYRNR